MWSNSHGKQTEDSQNNTFTTKSVKKDPQCQVENEEKQLGWNLPLRMKQHGGEIYRLGYPFWGVSSSNHILSTPALGWATRKTSPLS